MPAKRYLVQNFGPPHVEESLMRTRDWFRSHSFHHSEFADAHELGQLKREREISVTLILPTRNVAGTIGSVLEEVDYLRRPEVGLIDQVVVVDADSADGTAEIARGYNVEVYSENALMPEYGKTQGKGDAMWRGLSVATGDIIAFADTDTGNFRRRLVLSVVGCLIARPDIKFVKAAYRRPFTKEAVSVPDGGGRVTELTAKPALNLLFPELAGFVQPLAGEFGGTRDLLYSVPFFSGYAVEVGMLIDVLDACGLSAMAQVDAGMRKNRHQDLGSLSRMGYAVLRAVLTRAMQRRLGVSGSDLAAVAGPGVALAGAEPLGAALPVAELAGVGLAESSLELGLARASVDGGSLAEAALADASLTEADLDGSSLAEPAVPSSDLPDTGSYLHAVAAARGIRLDEYPEVMIERPPMRAALLERRQLASATPIGC
jgi:glucosyl-3-phosphoglycerate synthase